MKYYIQVAQNGDILGSMADDTGRLDPKIWVEVPKQIYGFRDQYGKPMLRWDGSKVVKCDGYDAAKWQGIRRTRNHMISETDWTLMSDSPLTASEKTEWKAYRKALRDLPENYPDPDKLVWPTKPG